MSKTQKDINQEIKAIEAQIEDTKNIRKHRPEYAELEKKMEAIRRAYREETDSLISCWESDIQALKKELKKKKEENKLQLSEDVQRWFRKYLGGVNFGYKEPRIVWISEDEKYVIITSPGSTAGTGTAMGTGAYYYAQSTHWLTEIFEGGTYLGSTRDSVKSPTWLEFDGRLTKEKKEEMIAFVETLRNGNRIYLERPGRLNKGCDFVIFIENHITFNNGNDKPPRHDFITNDLIIKNQNLTKANWNLLLQAIEAIYNCEPFQIAFAFCNNLPTSGETYELILKTLRWLFIEQDVTYWSGQGRNMLYNNILNL